MLADGNSTNGIATFQYEHFLVRTGEIRRGDQAIVAGADHNCIVWHGHPDSSPRKFLMQVSWPIQARLTLQTIEYRETFEGAYERANATACGVPACGRY